MGMTHSLLLQIEHMLSNEIFSLIFGEVDTMTNDDNEINRRTESVKLVQADCSHEEEQVTRALGTLRLLIDKDDPLSLRETIARARELAETYVRWEQSGALIKDLAVRLSDGQEIAVDQSNLASVCGLHFRDAFPADAVLHVWKKVDKQFGEVELLSLPLKDVQANGYNYKKIYKNGQTLLLRVGRCSDGQFDISVDYTEKEHFMVVPSRHRSWLRALGSAATLAFSKLGSLFSHPRPRMRPHWLLRPGATFVAGLMLATIGCYTILYPLQSPANSDKVVTTNPRVPYLQQVGCKCTDDLPRDGAGDRGQATTSVGAETMAIKDHTTILDHSSKEHQSQNVGVAFETPTSPTKTGGRVPFKATPTSKSDSDLDPKDQVRATTWLSDSRGLESSVKKKGGSKVKMGLMIRPSKHRETSLPKQTVKTMDSQMERNAQSSLKP
jgi:hypothetical protein